MKWRRIFRMNLLFLNKSNPLHHHLSTKIQHRVHTTTRHRPNRVMAYFDDVQVLEKAPLVRCKDIHDLISKISMANKLLHKRIVALVLSMIFDIVLLCFLLLCFLLCSFDIFTFIFFLFRPLHIPFLGLVKIST